MSVRLVNANDIIAHKECPLELQDIINEMPSVYTDEPLDGKELFHSPNQVKGRWIAGEYKDPGVLKCDRCGLPVSGCKPDFCPGCGADMRDGAKAE